jgi:hypothetical protein
LNDPAASSCCAFIIQEAADKSTIELLLDTGVGNNVLDTMSLKHSIEDDDGRVSNRNRGIGLLENNPACLVSRQMTNL